MKKQKESLEMKEVQVEVDRDKTRKTKQNINKSSTEWLIKISRLYAIQQSSRIRFTLHLYEEIKYQLS